MKAIEEKSLKAERNEAEGRESCVSEKSKARK